MKTKLMTMLLAAGAMLSAWADTHDKVQLWEGGPYWATTNIGADEPWDSGYYFWWGDTVGYKRENYAWVAADGSSTRFSFCSSNTPTYDKTPATLESEGWVVSQDGTYVLAPEHDAAQVQWGGGWRMPTSAELSALSSNCTWTWTTRNGVQGYVVAGRGDYATNSIFLPCAGSVYGGTSPQHAGVNGDYWSSVPGRGSGGADKLYFDSCIHLGGYLNRSYGLPVRPVQGFTKATAATSSGMQGRTGTAKSGTHCKTLNAAADMHNKVQLWAGGPYWADRNIGASKPEDYGLYFWWGDTVGYKRENSAWVASDGSSTRFSFGSSNQPTYNKTHATLESEGWVVLQDARYVLAPEHDAAQVQWGGGWRMPTYAELSALNSNCTWTWTTRNGVQGYVVAGKGDYASNSIFLPCAGLGYQTSLNGAGSSGNYWSSVPTPDGNHSGGLHYFDTGYYHGTSRYGERRYLGFSVRPVQGFTKATAATSSGIRGRTGTAKAGTHSKTLNAAKEQPSFHASNSTAKRTAKRGAAQYIVIDLSGGANAARYPYHFSSEGPDLASDTCRTTELWLRMIPPGTFTMGSPETELGRGCYEAQHSVTISKRFYLGVFEVTQKQYELVMGSNPLSTVTFAATHTGDTRPVACVSYDALRGSNIGANWPSDGQVDADSFFGKLRARTSLRLDLPTEAMWEYACRAGTTTALNNGKDLTDTMECAEMAEVGRYGYNIFDGKGGYSPGYTTKVGSYTPNAWGLYDMHGNVGELCLDWWQDNLGTEAVTDPKGATSGHCRIVRGGCWSRSNGSSGHASGCRSAARSNDCNSRLTGPDQTSYDWGFRVSVLPAN